jgi:hypothetical protein
MGQYYLIANIDKEQYIHPHAFGDGLKLMEFANSRYGVLCGLAVLLASGNNRGGGDLRSDAEIIGSWAGDRIVVAGDYGAPAGKHLDDIEGADDDITVFKLAQETFENVSDETIAAIVDGEGERHPLADIDPSEDGWRQKGEWGT